MTEFADVAIGDLFCGVNGRAKFIKDFLDRRSGEYPVYSASLRKPFGFVDEFEYDGRYLTWVMNGYGGRVQEITGRFSANRDRGVFIPREGVKIPDLTYLRAVMERQLTAAAVGRRVDGRLNEYTKMYPPSAGEVVIQLPLDSAGNWDYVKMASVGQKLRRIETAQADVELSRDALDRAVFPIDVSGPSATISVGDRRYFALSIGERVLRSEHADSGVPVYSANARAPFGTIAASNLNGFEKPSLLWGIDGTFDWNLIPAGQPFATTDHCGRLQVLDAGIDPGYVYQFMRATRTRYGFDRVFRSSLANMKAEVSVTVPTDSEGRFSLSRQSELADALHNQERARATALTALKDVLKARISIDL